MATITASLFSALDGVVDPAIGDWHFPYFNEEMGAAVGTTHDADVMLFGRVTYDSFAGLLDELHLFVHPATAGGGLRLFDDDTPPQHLKLVSATPFRTGVVHLVYAPDPNPPTGSYDEAKESLPTE